MYDVMVAIALAVAGLLVFSRIYKMRIKRSFDSSMSEKTKRSLGQVSGYSDASKTMAHHGLVADENTGHYYSQHRHCDAVLLNK